MIFINAIKNLLKFLLSFRHKNMAWGYIAEINRNSSVDKFSKIYAPANLTNTKVGYGTYISQNSRISEATIGKFCSIGPDFICGWGIHPTDAISTSPMFYSTLKQNGMSLTKSNKIDERKPIKIDNDVFIGAGVTVLDGVNIGDGAIIAAGSVVINDIPPYAIAGGVPAKVIKYKFSEDKIQKMLKIRWWDWEPSKLTEVEKYFFDTDLFIEKYYNEL